MDLFILQHLNKYRNTGKGFMDMARRIRINPIISDYYLKLGEDYKDLVLSKKYKYTDEDIAKRASLKDCIDNWQPLPEEHFVGFKDKMTKRALRIRYCGRTVSTKLWRELRIHNVRQVKLCNDKFCGNCQKQLANAREHKYTPLLRALSTEYDLYHIALTVPNCSGFELPATVGKILKAFAKFVKYLLGKKKIRGLDFINLGCIGAIRSLEITMNGSKSTYHPHLHCIFVFSKGLKLDEPKVFTNAYSYSHGRKVQQFSAFEILIQKLWQCCYDGGKVTKSRINLSDGYSCIVNNADGNYHQIFKYAIKGLLDEKKKEMKKDRSVEKGLTYQEFHDLFWALEHRRAMQGYGCFYGIDFNDVAGDMSEQEVKKLVKQLDKEDVDNEIVSESLLTVVKNIVERNEIYFSKNSILQNLDSLKDD